MMVFPQERVGRMYRQIGRALIAMRAKKILRWWKSEMRACFFWDFAHHERSMATQ